MYFFKKITGRRSYDGLFLLKLKLKLLKLLKDVYRLKLIIIMLFVLFF